MSVPAVLAPVYQEIARYLSDTQSISMAEITNLYEDAYVENDCECCGTDLGIETEIQYLNHDGESRSYTYHDSLARLIASAMGMPR